MKILHIINSLTSGGAEKLIEQMVPIMNNIDGIQADVLILTDKNNVFGHALEEKGVNLYKLKNNKMRNPFNVHYIKNLIKKEKYDVVHSHLFPSNYWTSLAKRLSFINNVVFITTEHNTLNRRRNKYYFKPIDKVIYGNYDKIISVSPKTQENLIKWLKPRERELKKFVTVKNGVDTKKFSDAKPYYKADINGNFTEETKLICMVASFTKQKDQLTLIKALKNLPDSVHLLLIGKGPLKEKNEKAAKDLGLSERVHFLGFRNDVERILKTSDIVVLSSKWEGLSLASIEGMASGSPFVASRVEGLEEIAINYGVLFEQGDVQELSEKLIELLEDKEYYYRVSELCLEKAKTYDIKRMVDRIVNIYYELAN